MKKGLVLTVTAAALLAVSCGKGGSKPAEKGFKLTEAVEFYASEGVANVTLPNYVAESEDAEITFSDSWVESSGWFRADITNSTKKEMNAFADSLSAKGWTVGAGRYTGDYLATFGDTRANMYVENWLEEDANCIRLIFWLSEEKLTIFPSDEVEAFFTASGIENVDVKDYAIAGADAYFVLRPVSYGILEVQVYGSSATEMAAYAALLGNNGWNVGPGEYTGDYLATFGETLATVEIQDWINYSYACVRLLFYVGEEPDLTFPFSKVVNFFGENDYEIPATAWPELSFSEDVTFLYSDDWAAFFGGPDVYVYGCTAAEIAKVAEDLVDNDWELVNYDEEEGDYSLKYDLKNGYDLKVGIYNYLDDYGYYDFFFSLTVHIVDEEVDEFPLARLNAFLTQYGLGFQLTEALSGDEFIINEFVSTDGYHCFRISTSGDKEAAWNAVFDALLPGAGYTFDDEDEYWYNDDDHQVSVYYDEVDNLTSVAFWE